MSKARLERYCCSLIYRIAKEPAGNGRKSNASQAMGLSKQKGAAIGAREQVS